MKKLFLLVALVLALTSIAVGQAGLSLNPTLYDCIKDNGVVARTTTFDPNSKNCDMVVMEPSPSVTVQWRQAADVVTFTGSILNWTNTTDGSTNFCVLPNGANQTPVPCDSAVGMVGTTLLKPYQVTKVSFTINPADPNGVWFGLFDRSGQIFGDWTPGGNTVNVTDVVQNVFVSAGDYLTFSISTYPGDTFTSISWVIQ